MLRHSSFASACFCKVVREWTPKSPSLGPLVTYWRASFLILSQHLFQSINEHWHIRITHGPRGLRPNEPMSLAFQVRSHKPSMLIGQGLASIDTKRIHRETGCGMHSVFSRSNLIAQPFVQVIQPPSQSTFGYLGSDLDRKSAFIRSFLRCSASNHRENIAGTPESGNDLVQCNVDGRLDVRLVPVLVVDFERFRCAHHSYLACFATFPPRRG